jgi:hypothetical protein
MNYSILCNNMLKLQIFQINFMVSSMKKLIKAHADFISIKDKEEWKKVPNKRMNGCGVYALYNNYGLYYIGKADTSIKSRLVKHKKSKKHKWNKYSWYQTKDYADAEAIESIMLRLVNPPDNDKMPKSITKKGKERLHVK